MRSGLGAARQYGYANARVKSMESRLLSAGALTDISNTAEISVVIKKLMDTDYRTYLEEFGGLGISTDTIDYALSKSLAANATKLVTITPYQHKAAIRSIVSKWDIENIKLLIEAKGSNADKQHVLYYLVDTSYITKPKAGELLDEPNVEAMIARMMLNSPYAQILDSAADTYRKTKSVLATNAQIERLYYESLAQTIRKIGDISTETTRIIRAEIDMKNILTLLFSLRHKVAAQDLQGALIKNGFMPVHTLLQLYETSNSIEQFTSGIKSFDLKQPLELYKNNGSKHLIYFEIGMRSSLFRMADKLLSHSVLSFGAVVAYMYMKQMEISFIRTVVKARQYKLSNTDISQMISWMN